MFGKRYQDQMDQTRTVIPVKEDGKSVLCKVYWETTQFGGTVSLPKSLFGDKNEGTLGRIGFVLV